MERRTVTNFEERKLCRGGMRPRSIDDYVTHVFD